MALRILFLVACFECVVLDAFWSAPAVPLTSRTAAAIAQLQNPFRGNACLSWGQRKGESVKPLWACSVTPLRAAKSGTETASRDTQRAAKKPAIQKGVLKSFFAQIDVDGDGYLDVKELQNTLDSVHESTLQNEQEVKDSLNVMDKDQDGRISEHDFISWFGKAEKGPVSSLFSTLESKIMRDNAVALFSSFDKDKNGFIDLDELQSLCNSLGFRYSKEHGAPPFASPPLPHFFACRKRGGSSSKTRGSRIVTHLELMSLCLHSGGNSPHNRQRWQRRH